MVMAQAKQHIQAEHGEGFWVDHWTYTLDLIESYLAIYPEKKGEAAFLMRILCPSLIIRILFIPEARNMSW